MSQHQQQAPPSFIGTYHTVESANAALAAAVRASNNGEINLVTPAPEVHYLPPMTAIMLRMYRPSRDQLFGVGGGRDAFTRGFIDVLGKAMRLQVVDARRTDDGSDGAVCSFAVVVAQPTFEGGQIMHVGNKTMNLQDDSPASAKMGKGLATARAFIAEHAETKARLRAFRTAIGIVAANTSRNLLLPWIVATPIPHVDKDLLSSDFFDRVAAAHLGVGDAIFGGPRQPAGLPTATPPAQLPPAAGDDSDLYDDDDPPPAQQQQAPPPRQQAPPAQQQPPKGGGMARDQVDILSGYARTLGPEEFQRIAQGALGKPADSRTMTAEEGHTLIQALTAASEAPSQPDDVPF